MSNLIELKVPDIGGHSNVDIVQVFIFPGKAVVVDDSLVTLETDKSTMDIPAERAGVIKEVKVVTGGKISEGDVIAILEVSDGSSDPDQEPTISGYNAIRVPDITAHGSVEVIDVAVQVGDDVAIDDCLITLETEQSTMKVPSSAAGRVVEVKVRAGDRVCEGDVIVLVESPAYLVISPPTESSSPAFMLAHRAHDVIKDVTSHRAYAGPSARRLARELGVDLGQVEGSGRKGRIICSDVTLFAQDVRQNAAARAQSAASFTASGLDMLSGPSVDFSRFGPTDRQLLSRIQKISGANLSRNWMMIPHVTFNDECDITELETFRKTLEKEWESSNLKIRPLAFIIKAAVAALKVFPAFNSSLDGDSLVLKYYYHIGFAVDTPSGLLVPVIKDADKKGVRQIAQELLDLSTLAREGKIKPADMLGASFTISSLGGIGGTSFTPIVNAPEVAILGVCKAQIKPVWDGNKFAPRLMCPLSLSFDHRVIDGAIAARFTVYLGELLSDVRRLIL